MNENDVKPDGGPVLGTRGMSLRDWFAGLAMQGILSCETYEEPEDEDDFDRTVHNFGGMRDHAFEAYSYADAMMAEREKGEADA